MNRPDTAPPVRDDFRVFHRLRVRWAEVDMQRIVFNANYLMYFDTAVTDYWRGLAMPYAEAMHALGGDLYVKKASVEFHASAVWDDRLDVGMRCARIGNSSLAFEGAIFRGEALLITGEIIYVFADPATQRPRPVPDVLRQCLSDFEAGLPVLGVSIGDDASHGDEARALRRRVFIDEQKIPADLEWDALDANALHGLARNRFGQAVATGRLLQEAPGVARIGRVATDRSVRGAGVGQALMRALVEQARSRGDEAVVLSAQRTAQHFYAALGFVAEGASYLDADIPHTDMRMRLR